MFRIWSLNAKLKPTCRLQTVFSTETRVLMRIYLHITKVNPVKVCMRRWRSSLNIALASQSLRLTPGRDA